MTQEERRVRRVAHVKELARLYCETGRLASVGARYGITRQAVSLHLRWGRRLGVIQYRPRERRCQAVARLSEILESATSLRDAARRAGYSGGWAMRELLRQIGVSIPEVLARMEANRRAALLAELTRRLEEYGIRDVNTYQISRVEPVRIVYERVRRLLGGVRGVRRALGLPDVDLRFGPRRRARAARGREHATTDKRRPGGDSVSAGSPAGLSG